MPSHFSRLLFVGALLSPAFAQSPQFTVVPAGYATTDAPSYFWVAGASCSVRQVTLVGASHLVGLVGRSITAIELRRSAADEAFGGGQANLVVSLSHSPRTPLRARPTYDANVGADAVRVFAGPVVIPQSPPQVGPVVAWSAANTVRIEFRAPFVYTGGTLCIDVVGTPIAGQSASWWMADAAFEPTTGVATSHGQGCGAFGGSSGAWAHAAGRHFVPGGHARFHAYGTHGGYGFAAFGMPGQPIPLTLLGLPAPGCDVHLSSFEAILPAYFEPETVPALMAAGGRADVSLWIPDSAAMFGVGMATQWFDWQQLATSNAIHWTVAAAMPTLDMTSIDGDPSEATGHVSVHLAHVLRFEHQ